MSHAECPLCHRPVRAYLKAYEGYCYECGCKEFFKSNDEFLKEHEDSLEVDRALVASWRING